MVQEFQFFPVSRPVAQGMNKGGPSCEHCEEGVVPVRETTATIYTTVYIVAVINNNNRKGVYTKTFGVCIEISGV